jgi:hypothetical protein
MFQFLVKGHDFFQVFGLTSSYHFIKDSIMLSFLVVPINPLGESYRLGLRLDHKLIKILLESHVKPVVKPNLLFNKSWIFFPLLPYQLCFAFIANFCSPIGI